VLLDDAYNAIVARVPSVATRLDGTQPEALQKLLVQVECAMVLRVLNNPDGKLEESGDDYSYRLDAARSTGALYVSDAEVALLSAGDAVAGGSFTIRPASTVTGSGYWASTDSWVPLP